jgi:hypothetical protein
LPVSKLPSVYCLAKKSNQRKGAPGFWLRLNLKVSLSRNKLLRSHMLNILVGLSLTSLRSSAVHREKAEINGVDQLWHLINMDKKYEQYYR